MSFQSAAALIPGKAHDTSFQFQSKEHSLNLHRPLLATIILFPFAAISIGASCGDDTAIPTQDADTKDTRSLQDGSPVMDASQPYPDGYPSFEDGGTDAEMAMDGCDAQVPNNGLPYGGGPVILNTVNVYLIWYGDWSYAPKAPGLVNDLVAGFNNSPIFNINTTYYQLNGFGEDGGSIGYEFDNCGTIVYGDAAPPSPAYPLWYPSYVSGQVQLISSVSITENDAEFIKYGKALTDANVWSIVSDQINANAFPSDTNAVYFLLTSKDITEADGPYAQCLSFCGWHNHKTLNKASIKYAFVGDPLACVGTCDEWGQLEDAGADAALLTPNNDFSADSMASIIFHELSEATGDPEINAWVGYSESADECAWQFGPTYQSANNDSPANQHLNNLDWLLQMQWVNADGGYCAQHL
jgi:phosphate-induced protein 1